MLKLILAKIFIGILFLLSLLSLNRVRRLGRFLGPRLCRLDKRTVASVNRNIELCFPHFTNAEREDLVLQRFKSVAQTAFEMSHVWTKSTKTLEKHFIDEFDNSVFENLARTDESMIVLVPHIGNWEMGNIYLNQHRRLTAMFQPSTSPALNDFILNARKRAGSDLVPTTSKGVAKIKKTLCKEKGMVAFLPDQVPVMGPGGIFAPFFGHQAFTMRLAHKLAMKTNVKVFMCAVYQRDSGFAVCVEPIEDGFYSNDPVVSATTMNGHIEKFILREPTQYQWEYKRFREQPEGILSPYKSGKYAFLTKRDPNKKRNR